MSLAERYHMILPKTNIQSLKLNAGVASKSESHHYHCFCCLFGSLKLVYYPLSLNGTKSRRHGSCKDLKILEGMLLHSSQSFPFLAISG